MGHEAVGPEGHIVPQPWLAHTTAPRVEPTNRRRLDLLLVSPLTRTGQPQPCGAVDGAALRVAERRKRATYPELAAAGPQRFIVLGAEVGGRWNGGALGLVRDLVLGTQLVEHPVGGCAAGRSWHGPRLCLADGLVSPAEAAQLKTGGFVM